MNTLSLLPLVIACTLACGCASVRGFMRGHGAEYRAEYEQHKAAVLAATDAEGEADALRALGLWFKRRPYGYHLSAASQPQHDGVDLNALAADEPVEVQVFADSDYEPREGGFSFVPKDKMNLLLLRGKPRAGR